MTEGKLTSPSKSADLINVIYKQAKHINVRAQARAQYLAGSGPDKRKAFGDAGPQWNPPPASFASMGLFVKWGANIMIAEGQSLYAVRHFLKGSVPVPELYGWRTDGGEVFIYMELVHGQTLERLGQ
uniref:Aminoglycoside phosphotransferase domain-containing protein n=1 Tax=Coccidioides posadasii RMSCC 3488 TaxID=454284 RepID=A0A0J6F0V5_COCPO|nr:hypothetical protein CPAG_02850 [Coccidioides posadasii RMSCC 3488]